jgi:hypothetical protein
MGDFHLLFFASLPGALGFGSRAAAAGYVGTGVPEIAAGVVQLVSLGPGARHVWPQGMAIIDL